MLTLCSISPCRGKLSTWINLNKSTIYFCPGPINLNYDINPNCTFEWVENIILGLLFFGHSIPAQSLNCSDIKFWLVSFGNINGFLKPKAMQSPWMSSSLRWFLWNKKGKQKMILQYLPYMINMPLSANSIL